MIFTPVFSIQIKQSEQPLLEKSCDSSLPDSPPNGNSLGPSVYKELRAPRDSW